MAEKSLFAVLLRSPWWMSIGVALLAAGIAAAVLPAAYVPYGVFGAAPFLVTGAIAGWRQLRAPSQAQLEATLQRLGAMAWPQFAGAVELAFKRDGHAVERLARSDADFELTKAGRTSVLSCKRWKAARTGIEALRELHAAQRSREAVGSVYMTLGELSDNAREYARENGIRVMQASEVATLLRDVAGSRGKHK